MLMPLLKSQLPELVVSTLRFSGAEFADKAAAAAWAKAEGFDGDVVETDDGGYVVSVRDEGDFLEGSFRELGQVDAGVTATVGMPALKSIAKLAPKLGQLYLLEDLEIHEVTLTRSPAVGAMAEFKVFKSIGAEPDIEKACAIVKVDSVRKQVFGYALVPDLPDFQSDVVTGDGVEEAAHSFLKAAFAGRAHKGDGIGEEHETFDGVGYPIESMIDRDGLFGVKGGWWLGVQVTDDAVWKSIEDGEIKGFSIGGKGRRKKLDEFALKARAQRAVLNKALEGEELYELGAKVCAALDAMEQGWPYVEALFIDCVVYCVGYPAKRWRRPFVVEGDEVRFGDRVRVERSRLVRFGPRAYVACARLLASREHLWPGSEDSKLDQGRDRLGLH